MYANVTISNTVIFLLLAEFLFSLAVPVTAMFLWHKYTDAAFSPFVMGAAVFFVFVMVAEQIIHALVLGISADLAEFLRVRPWLYALYGGLLAALFEETGRFLVYRTMMKKYIARQNVVSYGLGHGGMECVMMLGASALSNFAIALLFNSMGAEAFIAEYAPADASALIEAVGAINAVDGAATVWAFVERLTMMCLQLEFSVLVFAAVRLKKVWLYPAAMVLHLVMDVLAGVLQNSAGGIWVLEVVMLVYAAALVYPILKLYKKLPKEDAPKLDRFGRDPRLGLI